MQIDSISELSDLITKSIILLFSCVAIIIVLIDILYAINTRKQRANAVQYDKCRKRVLINCQNKVYYVTAVYAFYKDGFVVMCDTANRKYRINFDKETAVKLIHDLYSEDEPCDFSQYQAIDEMSK